MLSVTTLLPQEYTARPAVLMVHGSVNSAAVWTFWQRALTEHGWPTCALDLRGHGRSDAMDLSATTMEDYAADLGLLARQFAEPPVVMGWSMGGLVALMAAAAGVAGACIAMAPSPPARSTDASAELRKGEFGPEEYGLTSMDPEVEQRALRDLDRDERAVALASLGTRESRRARDQRHAGIVIEKIPCPVLLVTGSRDRHFPEDTYQDLWLPVNRLSMDASHWGLALNRRAIAGVLPSLLAWLESHTTTTPPQWFR